ncbi:MAG: hypothetical protein L0K90_09415, partial [Staphylococcus equorum]|nr:hypothetical protein [Staphylococcus equorum]
NLTRVEHLKAVTVALASECEIVFNMAKKELPTIWQLFLVIIFNSHHDSSLYKIIFIIVIIYLFR